MAKRGRPVRAAFRLSVVAAAALISLNFHPIRSQHITSDRGVWEDSWVRAYGWPRRACQEWRLEENTGTSWNWNNVLFNGRVVLASGAAVFCASLALLHAPRFSIFGFRLSSSTASARTPSGSPSGSAGPSRA